MAGFIPYVENKLKSADHDSLTAMAAKSLLSSIKEDSSLPGDAGQEDSSLTGDAPQEDSRHSDDAIPSLLTLWIFRMAWLGLSPSTRKRYFGKIHSLYKEWKSGAGDDPFLPLKGLAEAPFSLPSDDIADNLRILRPLFNIAPDAPEAIPVHLFLYLLLDPSISPSQAINLKFDSPTPDCPQIDDIIDARRKVAGRAKYIFPLSQGKKRDTQILRKLLTPMREALASAGLSFPSAFSRDSITEIWIAAALKNGISPTEVRSIVASLPTSLSLLSTLPAVTIPEERKTEILRKVADSICDNASQWFVMKMRAGQTPESIKERIAENAPEIFPLLEFFYPTHKVAKKSPKGKIIHKETPILPGILFFKAPRNKVALLMSRIGDAAWCYKWVNAAGSDYCSISRSEMLAFQKHIGSFTDDIRMEIEVSARAFAKGDAVKISGGRMEGHEAIVESSDSRNGTRTYTLRLTNFLLAKWTVSDVEEFYLQPLDTK